MIYEVRTHVVRPGQTPKFLDRFGEAYEGSRKKYSEMIGCWYTEIGPLNNIIHIWPYDSHAHRDEVRAAAEKEAAWPPDLSDLVISGNAETFIPYDFSPKLEPGEFGPYYEMRIYEINPGNEEDILIGWPKALPERTKRSPMAVLMHSDLGAMHKLIHIWPYKDLNQRSDVRRQAVADKIWPPSVVHKSSDPRGTFSIQDNLVMLPAPFSPMQ